MLSMCLNNFPQQKIFFEVWYIWITVTPKKFFFIYVLILREKSGKMHWFPQLKIRKYIFSKRISNWRQDSVWVNFPPVIFLNLSESNLRWKGLVLPTVQGYSLSASHELPNMGTENQTQTLCKRSKCSQPLNHLSNLQFVKFYKDKKQSFCTFMLKANKSWRYCSYRDQPESSEFHSAQATVSKEHVLLRGNGASWRIGRF